MAIDSATIAAAEQLMGVACTETERALMAEGLAARLAQIAARRGVSFANDFAPASRFDPRLPGFPPPAPQRPLRWSMADPGPLPGDEADIAFAPVAHLARWIGSGALTSRRLTEIYLARIAALAPGLECFAAVLPERALAEAEAMDGLSRAGISLGPLHGIPYALKDLFDVAGAATGWGAEPFAGRVAEADAAVVARLRAAGAVLLGKTAVGALAYGDVWYGGRSRNPWNPAEGSSGSSAGSAAAVAAGLCGFAIGTETLGSITSPSERCGTTGLRPTYGRVSRAGGMALAWSLDKVGPICRAVEDCGLVLAAINGGDLRDAGSIEMPFNHDAAEGIAGLRLGWLPAVYAEDAVTEVDRAALDAARGLGCEVVEVALPDLPYGALRALLDAEAAAAFEEMTLSDADDRLRRQDISAWPNSLRQARFLSAVEHVQLDRLRRRAMEVLDEVFRRIDLLVGPHGIGPMLVASNFTGHPCLHLRAGFQRLPTRIDPWVPALEPDLAVPEGAFEVPRGVSLWAGLFEESRLIRFGMALERALGVADRRPAPALA